MNMKEKRFRKGDNMRHQTRELWVAAVVCIAVISMIGCASGQVMIPAVETSYSTTPATLKPDAEFRLDVDFVNMGWGSALNLYVSVDSYDPDLKVTSEKYANLGSLGPYSSSSATFKLQAEKSGLYEVRIKASYTYYIITTTTVSGTTTTTTSGPYTGTIEKRITLQVQRESNFVLTNISFSQPPEPGKSVTVSFKIKNLGERAEEATVELQTRGVTAPTPSTEAAATEALDAAAIPAGVTAEQVAMYQEMMGGTETATSTTTGTSASAATPSEVITTLGSNEEYIGSWASYGEKTIEYKIHVDTNAQPGAYTLPLVVKYEDVLRQDQSDTISIGVDITGVPKIDITKTETDPDELKAGESYAKLTLKIDNVGTDSVKYLKVSLNATHPFKLSTAYSQIYETGLLDAGGSADAIFNIDVERDAKSGSYTIPVEIDFQDSSGKEHSETEHIDITIKEKPNFEVVSVQTSPETVAQGQKVEIHVTIRNIGSEEGESVSVRAFGESEQPFEFDVKSDFIGNLKPNETGEAVLELTVDNDAPLKAYNLDMEIRCTGDKEIGDDNVYTFDRTVPLSVSAAKGVPGFEAMFAIAGLLAVAYLMPRRRH